MLNEQHAYLISKLEAFRNALNEIKPIASIEEIMDSGVITNQNFTELLENFRRGDDLYVQDDSPFFDSDLRAKIERVREPIISWVDETGCYFKEAYLKGEEIDEAPSFAHIISEVISYLCVLTEATNEQIARIEHYGSISGQSEQAARRSRH